MGNQVLIEISENNYWGVIQIFFKRRVTESTKYLEYLHKNDNNVFV